MAIDTMVERLKNNETMVDIFGYVSMLRNQRNFMVQTEVSPVSCSVTFCYPPSSPSLPPPHPSLLRTSTSSSMRLLLRPSCVDRLR